MVDQLYNWKRFWRPREGSINLSDGGYLYDPDSEWGHIYNPEVVSFEKIANVQCLALLGEPGIGKSFAMQTERKAVDSKIEEEGGQSIWLDLRSYGSEYRLVRDLFESPTFSSWRNGTHQLHVFLDSLDECLLKIKTLAALLVDEFKKYPSDRLYLRVACRTADWPDLLENGLKEIWGDEAYAVYELTPLRRVDVKEASNVNGLAPDVFLHEIDNKEAVPLAIKPVTLEFLLKTYRQSGQFPSTQAELYLQGCRLLCEEQSESCRAAGHVGNLTAEQRLAVAARIATTTVFASRYAIWTGIDSGDVPEEDITIRILCGKSEPGNGDRFDVGDTAVKETLATGLFSLRGPHRLGWAHQTYAEFLAARYLIQNNMTLTQMMSLLIHPGDPDGKLVPQLHETAAWLAGMEPDVFREIMKREPEVLLRSDVATADEKDRAALVDALLILLDEEKLLDRDWTIHGRYKKLDHPGLAEQLRPYICDSTKGIIVRREAIDIAETCELKSLQHELVDIALDISQPIEVRKGAAYAIRRIGDEEIKAKLKPLALGEAGDDPDDALKGCALRCIWPKHITVSELFTCITPPKRGDLVGSYHMFLTYELTPYLSPDDLPEALKWIEALPRRHGLPFSLRKLMDGIILRAWEHIDSPEVLVAFAKAILSRLKHHDDIVGNGDDSPFKKVLVDDDIRRRLILEAMVPLLSSPERQALWLCSRIPMALSKDILWFIDKLKESTSEQDQRNWAELISITRDLSDLEQLDAILITCQQNPILAEQFSWLINEVKLDSQEARKMKANYLENKKRQEREYNPPKEPPTAEQINNILDEYESGKSEGWLRLTKDMTFWLDKTYYEIIFNPDITILPGWKVADGAARARIVKAAERYVLDADPKTEEWLGTTPPVRAFAGYKALFLLAKEAPNIVFGLPIDVWKRWAPAILGIPDWSDTFEEEGKHKELIQIAYEHAPDEIIKSLIVLIDKENREGDHIFITYKVECIWDDRIANALLAKLTDKKLKPKCIDNLLSDLLDRQVGEAKTFAESIITLPLPKKGKRREKAKVAARVLLKHSEDGGWSVIWPAFQQDTKFGREVVTEIAHGPERREGSVGQNLTEDHLVDLYIWLVGQFPYTEDPQHEGAHWVEARESIGHWRDALLQQLKMRGTHQACEAIRRIAHELPELNWLKWTLLEAQSITRRATWAPPRPVDILEMARARDVRLVQSGDQLLEVIIESLKRFEAKLHGETPAIRTIWDRVRRDVYRPIDENEFSDQVKIHLDEDLRQRGIIVNREVRIHRGERTDIHVDAVMQNQNGEGFDSITVIIEVKGCWHPELNQAMETQLVNRYLKDNRCQYGLYLVGWFNCELWDNQDYRKGRVPELTLDEAEQQFNTQAAELSQGDTRIRAVVMDTALS